jgi:hypothetical protein
MNFPFIASHLAFAALFSRVPGWRRRKIAAEERDAKQNRQQQESTSSAPLVSSPKSGSATRNKTGSFARLLFFLRTEPPKDLFRML